MATRRGKARGTDLLAAGGVALALHGLTFVTLRLGSERLVVPPALPDPEPVGLAPLDEAEARELLGAFPNLPGESSGVPALVSAPLAKGAAKAAEGEAPARGEAAAAGAAPSASASAKPVAAAVPRLTDPVISTGLDRVRVPPVPRAPAAATAGGEVRPLPRLVEAPPAASAPAPTPGASTAPAASAAPPVPPPVSPTPATPAVTRAPETPARTGDAGAPPTLAAAPASDAGAAPVRALPLVIVSDTTDLAHLPVGGARGEATAPVDAALALFNLRMNQRVKGEWHPKDVYRQVNPNLEGEINTDGATTIEVRLRADGSLERARITKQSGTPALDQEALASLQRAQPFSPPPRELIDAAGGITFPYRFDFDLTVAAFHKQLTRKIRAGWRPSPAFRRFGGWGEDRSTVVRLLLREDGALVHASVVGSSGVDLLDNSALASLKPGTQLAAPAPILRRPGALVPVRIVFVHALRGPDLVYAEREPVKPANQN